MYRKIKFTKDDLERTSKIRYDVHLQRAVNFVGQQSSCSLGKCKIELYVSVLNSTIRL